MEDNLNKDSSTAGQHLDKGLIVTIAVAILALAFTGVAWWHIKNLQADRDRQAAKVEQLDKNLQVARQRMNELASEQAKQAEAVEHVRKAETLVGSPEKQQMKELMQERDQARERLTKLQQALSELNEKYAASTEVQTQLRQMIDHLRDENTQTREQLQKALRDHKAALLHLRDTLASFFVEVRPASLVRAEQARTEAEGELQRLQKSPSFSYRSKIGTDATAEVTRARLVEEAQQRLRLAVQEAQRLDNDWKARRNELLAAFEMAAAQGS